MANRKRIEKKKAFHAVTLIVERLKFYRMEKREVPGVCLGDLHEARNAIILSTRAIFAGYPLQVTGVKTVSRFLREKRIA